MQTFDVDGLLRWLCAILVRQGLFMFDLFKKWFLRYFSDPQALILWFLLLFGFILVIVLGNMLLPVFISVIIAYLLEGMVTGLQRLKSPRPISVAVVFILFMTSFILILVVLLPLLSRQIGQLLQELPSMINYLKNQLMELPDKYPDIISRDQLNEVFDFIGSGLLNLGRQLLSLSLASVRGIITILVYLILVPLLVFFFLKDKEKIIAWVSGFLPRERKLAADVWLELNLQIGNYVRGKIWEILIVWGVTYAAFSVLKLQYSMLLALFTGLSVLIPYIGATVMFLPVALIAYFQWGWGADFAYALLAYAIIQILDGNLLVPLLLSEVVNLHPVAIIVAVLVFGGLWGIWGLFLAIPLATLVQSVMKAWVNHNQSITKPTKKASA
jgi:putative permease